MHKTGLSTITVTLAVAAPLWVGGCDKAAEALQGALEDKVAEQAEAAQEAAAGGLGADAPEEAKLEHKLNLYVQCINRSRNRIYDSFQRYDDYLKDDGTPRKKNAKPFIYRIDAEIEPCKEAAEKGPNMSPSLPELEKAQAEYAAAGEEFAKLSQDLETYYKQENYKDDDWAKSKDLGPKFAAAFKRFDAATKDLEKNLDEKKDEADAKMLAHIEQTAGKKIEYFTRAYLIKSKRFVRCLDGDAPTADGCEEPFKALEQANNDFRGYYDANKEAANKVFWMSSFEGSVDDYYTHSKKLMRLLRDGKTKPDEIKKVVDEYNDLVGDSNNLRFDFPG